MTPLRLEQLEYRDSPAALAGFMPHHPVRDGVQVRDFEQGYVATDCAAVATFASAVRTGVDLQSRIHEVSLYHWDVSLFSPTTGQAVQVRVRFNGVLNPYDPTCRHGEFLSLLLLRAYHKLVPSSVNQGDSLERAAYVVFGHLPYADDSPRAVGYTEIMAALARGDAVTFCTDAHAFTLTYAGPNQCRFYNPWGAYGTMRPGAFLLPGRYEVAITETEP